MNEAAFGRFLLVATVPEVVSNVQYQGKIYGRSDTVPTDGSTGWAKGALYVQTDGGDGTTLYINEGTVTSSNFDPANDVSTYLPLAGGTMDDAADIALGTTTGSKIGTAVAQKLGFWNATPVVQPASADQADPGAMTTVGANTGTAGAGLSLIGDTTAVDQAANIMNDLKALQEDITALDTLLTAVRTALVSSGIMKGSA